jgi:hypothetical protein
MEGRKEAGKEGEGREGGRGKGRKRGDKRRRLDEGRGKEKKTLEALEK